MVLCLVDDEANDMHEAMVEEMVEKIVNGTLKLIC